MFTIYNNFVLRKYLPAIEDFLKSKKKQGKAVDSLLTDADISREDLLEAVKHVQEQLGGQYVTTIHVLVSAITKLRNVSPLPKDHKVRIQWHSPLS